MNTGRLLRYGYSFSSDDKGYWKRIDYIKMLTMHFAKFLVDECLDNSGWVGFGKEY